MIVRGLSINTCIYNTILGEINGKEENHDNANGCGLAEKGT
jgi:hypothetical protein